MTTALPFTEAKLRRAVRAVQRSGLTVTAIEHRPDGTFFVHTGPLATAPKSLDDGRDEWPARA